MPTSIELISNNSYTYGNQTFVKNKKYTLDDDIAQYLLDSKKFKLAGTPSPIKAPTKQVEAKRAQRNIVTYVPEPEKKVKPIHVVIHDESSSKPTMGKRKIVIKKPATVQADAVIPNFRSKKELHDYAQEKYGIELDNGPDAKKAAMLEDLQARLAFRNADDTEKRGAVAV